MTALADEIEPLIPYLRRYARALTGEQEVADNLAYDALKAIQSDRSRVDRNYPVKLSLYRAFHQVWSQPNHIDRTAKAPPNTVPSLEANSRETLLLATLEGFDRVEIGFILSVSSAVVADLLRQAARDMQSGGTGKVLIVEDDAIIATDLRKILEERGHEVLAVARTLDEAVKVAHVKPPELILADIQLADGSSGIDAVREIMSQFGQLPIIFVTAFPERLLTGQRPEPAFLITKPYRDEQVASAVSQAMFFSSTETLIAD